MALQKINVAKDPTVDAVPKNYMTLVRSFVLLCICVAAALAQETRSTINGHVYDQSKLVVAGVKVVVVNVGTNSSVTLATNDAGYYEASLLLPGKYRITASAAGFKTVVREGVDLTVGTQVTIDLKMDVGTVLETVQVTAEAPVLDTNSVEAGALIDNKEVMDLPVLGNNPTLLTKLMPGIQTDGLTGYAGLHSIFISLGSGYYNAAKVGGNEWSVDGTPNNGGERQAAYLPYSDSVAEFRIDATGGFDVSRGRGTGVTVTAMTKSGTNQVHGTLTEQHWQQRFNGTPYFTRQLYFKSIADAEAKGDSALANKLRNTERQPSGHSNNWAATIGGPVVIPKVLNGRNKLFVFFAYNGYKDKKTEEANQFNKTVPTMAERQGDFSASLLVDPSKYQIYDPLSVRRDTTRTNGTFYVRDPIPGNIVPKARFQKPNGQYINPLYDFYSKLYPVPNNAPTSPTQEPRNNYMAYGTPWLWDYLAFQQRLDYNLSPAHRFFARWSWNNFEEDRLDWTYSTIRGMNTGGLNRKNQGATVDWTWAVNSSTLLNVSGAANEFTSGNRLPVPMSYKPSDLGLPKYLDDWAGDQHIVPLATIGGYTSAVPSGAPSFTHYRVYAVQANLSHYRGNHSLKGGADTRYHFRTGGGGGNTSGNFNFDNRYTKKYSDNLVVPGDIGLSWASFLMGLPYQSSITAGNATYAAFSPYYGGYLMDQWRVTRRLSMTLGLRLEWEGGPTERYNRMLGYFDQNTRIFVTDAAEADYKSRPMALDSSYFGHPVTGLGAANFKVRGGTTLPGITSPRDAWQSQFMPMPRFAFAYSISDKTLIRGGVGMFYDTLNVTNNTPNQTGFNRTTTVATESNSGLTWRMGDPANGISPLTDPFPANRANNTRFDTSTNGALGYDTYTGRSYTYSDYDTRRAHQYRWRVGVQRQIGRSGLFSATYTGSYSEDVYITSNLNSVPAEYYWNGRVRNSTLASYLNGGVANPFNIANFTGLATSNPTLYADMNSQTFFTNTAVARNQLLKPFPAMTGLSQSNSPMGRVRTNGVEMTFNRRFSQGFNWNIAYTGTKARTADWFPNPYDTVPAWRESNNARPHRITSTGRYEFPFGKGRQFVKSGFLSKALGGMQMSGTLEYQKGPLLDFGNLFYYGSLDDIKIDNPAIEQYFNTKGTPCSATNHGAAGSGFERCANNSPDSFQVNVFPTRISGLRKPYTFQVNGNVQKEIAFRDGRVKFILRFDMLNVFNRYLLDGPNTDPMNTNFGVITQQTQSINRFLQFQARVQF